MLNVAGGVNWRGGSLDPDTKILYVSSSTSVFPVGLINDPKQSEMNYYGSVLPRNPNPSPEAKGENDLQIQGLPLVKPPWAPDYRSGFEDRRAGLAGPAR